MINAANTIEDLLEILAGLQGQAKIQIESSDYNLLYSMARQVFKGTGLTDRQYELAKEKLTKYKDQFTELDYNFDTAIESLRIPLRELDRSRWMKIVDYPNNVVYESYKTHHWIAVRFIFNKKLISLIEAIRSTDKDAIYDKENKIHYFTLSEKNIFNVINALRDKDFDIEPELQEKYEKIKSMHDNKNDYVPGVYGFKLKNLNQKAIDYIISDIGTPDINNLALFKDRQRLYGLNYFDQIELDTSINQMTTLSQKLVKRTERHVLVNNETFNFDRLSESLIELDRFPLLIILNEKTDFDELVTTYDSFRNIIDYDNFCVLYRKDNLEDQNKYFNEYIKNNNLNNKLDNKPTVVYISKNKFPKTLLKTNWKPKAAIMFGSNSYLTNNKLSSYLNELDLVIHYDNDISPFMKSRIEII
jgi:hypothetical protein